MKLKSSYRFGNITNGIIGLAAIILLAGCLDDLPIIGSDDPVVSGSSVTYALDGGAATTSTAAEAGGVCIWANQDTFFNQLEIQLITGTRSLSMFIDGAPEVTGTYDASLVGVDLTYFGGSSFRYENSGTITVAAYGAVGGGISGSFDVVTEDFFGTVNGGIVGTFNVTRDNNDLDYPTTAELSASCFN